MQTANTKEVYCEIPAFIEFTSVNDGIAALCKEFKLPALSGGSGQGWSMWATLERCPHAYFLKYVKQFETETPRAARDIGSLVHFFLAIKYLRQMDILKGHCLPNPAGCKQRLVAANVNPEAIHEAWRLFEAYESNYSTDYLIPLAVEERAIEQKTGNTCRYDLIAEVKNPPPGTFPGVYIVEHKCLPGTARVLDRREGRYRTIFELFSAGTAPQVLAFKAGKLVETPANAPTPAGVKDIYTLLLTSGRRLRASDNHPVLTSKGWMPLASIKRNDWVAVPAITGATIPREVSVLGRFIGMMLGDGHVGAQLGFTQLPGPVLDDFIDLAKKLDIPCKLDAVRPPRACRVVISNAREGTARLLFVRLGLYGRSSGNKFIPAELKTDEHAASVIGGMWDTDGCIHQRKTDVIMTYASKSQQLCFDMQELLLRLGINSVVRTNPVKINGITRNYYRVIVVGRGSKRKFLVLLRDGAVPNVRLKKHAEEALETLRARDDEPIPIEIFAAVAREHIKELPKMGRIFSRGVELQSVERSTLALWAQTVPQLSNFLQDVFWEQADTVIIDGREMTYDLEVPNVHNFVVDDVITHNTASTFGQDTLEGWDLDGEILGEAALWSASKMQKKYGNLQGIIINIIGKQKSPQFYRTIVSVSTRAARKHLRVLDHLDTIRTHFAARRVWPQYFNGCIQRYGRCDYYQHCLDQSNE